MTTTQSALEQTIDKLAHDGKLPIPGLHIEGRRWFQKSYGNTYHSVRIYRTDCETVYLPMRYGYGDQFLQTAIDFLRTRGYGDAEYGTQYLREQLGGTCSVIDVPRQKDL
jgi:hypothetical protein